MAFCPDKYEFDLTVKHYGQKPSKMYDYPSEEEKNKSELLEKLQFNTLSAVEVIRKLLDYIY